MYIYIIRTTKKNEEKKKHYLVDGTIATVGTVLHAIGILLRRLDHLDVGHGALDDDVILPKIVVSLLIDHQQLSLVGKRLDALDHLVVGLVRDVDLVHLDYTITLSQTGRLTRRAIVHLADKLTVLALLRVQIKAVAGEVVPLDDVAQPGARRLIVLQRGHRVASVSLSRTRKKKEMRENLWSHQTHRTDVERAKHQESRAPRTIAQTREGTNQRENTPRKTNARARMCTRDRTRQTAVWCAARFRRRRVPKRHERVATAPPSRTDSAQWRALMDAVNFIPALIEIFLIFFFFYRYLYHNKVHVFLLLSALSFCFVVFFFIVLDVLSTLITSILAVA